MRYRVESECVERVEGEWWSRGIGMSEARG